MQWSHSRLAKQLSLLRSNDHIGIQHSKFDIRGYKMKMHNDRPRTEMLYHATIGHAAGREDPLGGVSALQVHHGDGSRHSYGGDVTSHACVVTRSAA
jgi:hypothetical protein